MAVVVAALGLPWGVAQAATPTAPAVHRVDVNTLPKGPEPRVAYLTGRLLHTPSGRVIALPFPKARASYLELLGPSPRGWLVADRRGQEVYGIERDGSRHPLVDVAHAEPGYPGFADLTLSTNHHLLLATFYERDDTVLLTVYNLAGDEVDSFYSGFGPDDSLDHPAPIAFVGRDVWLVYTWKADEPLMRWTMGSEPVDTGLTTVVQVDPVHDQVLWKPAASSEYGLSALSAPGDLLWTAPLKASEPGGESFSPDGTKFVGDDSHRVFVQSAADGHVVAADAFTAPHALVDVVAVRWEGSRHVLVEVAKQKPTEAYLSPKDPHAVLRCDLESHCTRTTLWQRHWLLGWALPY